MIIKQIYIDQSKKIINKFNELVNRLLTYQTNLEENKQYVLKLQKQIEIIDMSSDEPLLKQNKLEKLLLEYDIKISKIEQEISPIVLEMDELKKQSKIVYDKIITEYSNYTEKEIQEQIQKQLQS